MREGVISRECCRNSSAKSDWDNSPKYLTPDISSSIFDHIGNPSGSNHSVLK